MKIETNTIWVSNVFIKAIHLHSIHGDIAAWTKVWFLLSETLMILSLVERYQRAEYYNLSKKYYQNEKERVKE